MSKSPTPPAWVTHSRIAIRTAGLPDAAAIAAIRAATAPSAHVDKADVDAATLVIDRCKDLLFVADADGEAVGYVALLREGHAAVAAHDPLMLWQLHVRPRFHGAGVAALLMRRAIEQAESGAHDTVWLGVSEHNARAIAFYRKHGFVAHGLHDVGSGEHAHHDLIMLLALRTIVDTQ